MNKHFIVLNGKRYDAITGALLSDHTAPAAQPAAKKAPLPSAPPVATHTQQHPKPRMPRDHHGAPKHVAHHKPHQAKTLMRKAVQKPTHGKGTPIKTNALAVPATHAIQTKKAAHRVDHHRLKRAQAVHKSHHVARFSQAHPKPIAASVQPIPVAAAPAHKTVVAQAAPHQQPKIQPAVSPHARKEQLLTKALESARSHEEPAPKLAKKRGTRGRRAVSSLAGLAAVLVIVGFVTYLNKSSVELQVASVKAGFQASQPGAIPAGYEQQAAQNDGKSVRMSFVSPASNSGFTLTQESSGWDSQTLFDSVVARGDNSYQTVQHNGQTIYIYDEDKAAWVSGGILYKITGAEKLQSDDIIALASSM